MQWRRRQDAKRNGADSLTEDKCAIPEQSQYGATGSPSTNRGGTPPGTRGARSDQPPAETGDGELGGTIQFKDYSRQVAWDRFWDQMYALMLPIVVERTRLRSADSAAAQSDASEEKEL